MKHAGHVLAAIAVTLVCSAGASLACDQEKTTTAAAASMKSKRAVTAVTADASGHACTAEQMAACKARGASAVTAAHAGCAAKGAKATTAAMTAAAGHAGCASKSTATAVVAGAGSHCGSKGVKEAGVSAMAVGSGSSCSGHGMAKAAGQTAHADCDACLDMSSCGAELTAAQAHTQVVPLKNGVMFVYTADSPSQITAVQSAMARRGERMAQFVTAGEKARLCTECKSLRSAMSSGKLNREVVNIEGGALTLMTSDDPTVVAKIHAMVDVKGSGRTKS